MMKLYKFELPRAWILNALGVILVFVVCDQINAQSLRDPTLPPVETGLVDNAQSGKSSDAMTIIVRNGRPFLVVGTRLYATGQKLGQARIERISETEIWLREAGVLRKIPQFSGIQRRASASVSTKPVCKSLSSKSTSSVAPCADVQP